MIIKILRVYLHDTPIGRLFSYGDLCRFVADAELGVSSSNQLPGRIVSLSMLAANSAEQAALWANIQSPQFNAQGGRLPTFFQNLLPEGVLRRHIASMRGCSENDHFELLAACGKDLPGAITVRYEETSHEQLQRLVTQDNDALEMSVINMPMQGAISVSGMQPKLALVKVGARYVHRTRNQAGTRIIAKLPVVGQPFMPLLEQTALTLAKAAGVDVCVTELAKISAIESLSGYTLPDESDFLAVTRFDRDGAQHLHFEDFAQVLNTDPTQKYTRSYLEIAQVLMTQSSMGEGAVLELVRRLVVNELLGNPDAHLKNFGVLYAHTANGIEPTFAPAFDIVPYAISQGIDGHALSLLPKPPGGSKSAGAAKRDSLLFSPTQVREFAARLGLQEYLVRAALKSSCSSAHASWPELIAESGMPAQWQEKLLNRLNTHPLMLSMRIGVKKSL